NGGTSLGGPDQAGLQGKVLPGGIVYITFHEFSVTGTYKITDAVKAMLDKAVAQGAKAWSFDLRGNIGGNGADLMASWFLNGGTSLGGPDQAGLQGKVLPGGIVYITFHEFSVTGTYKITDAVKAMLDKAVAQGAKAWLFDLRGNIGGNGADLMASWFLNGEPTLSVVVKTGNAGTSSGNKDLRLPQAYQLPIAIVQNDRGGDRKSVV